MKREDCYMTFTEALEQYLLAREARGRTTRGSHADKALVEEMAHAAAHMDALTALPEQQQ